MNNAYTQLIERKPQLYRFKWGELITGHLEGFLDGVHPGDNARGLWADIVLYYLSRLKGKK